jgi:hypothetical protein
MRQTTRGADEVTNRSDVLTQQRTAFQATGLAALSLFLDTCKYRNVLRSEVRSSVERCMQAAYYTFQLPFLSKMRFNGLSDPGGMRDWQIGSLCPLMPLGFRQMCSSAP